MAITVKHKFVSAIPDAGDPTIVQPSNWNDTHELTGLGTMAEQNANSVAITGGTISGVAVTGYVPTTETITAGTGLTGGGDLSANRTIALANTAVTTGTYGNAARTITQTVDQQGRLTNIFDQPIAIANTQVSGLGTASTKDAGVANGVATLDGSGTVPISQLPSAVLGALSYQGTWNASTNTPTLTSSVGTKGYYYVVSVAGTTNLNGITDWQVGDWAVYNGTAWQKIDNTDAVTSVNGKTGTVVLTNTDISGFGTMSTQNANAVAITGGNIDGTTIGATTPAVITGSIINANTKVVSPDYYAQSVLGGNLRTSGGTSLVNWDGGGSGNVTVNGGLIVDPANKNINMSPTGTGSVTINPATVGAMDNMVIGATTPKAITGTTVTATTFSGSGASLTSIPNSALVNSAITINGNSTALGGSVSVGTVTSVTGTAPVVSSGGATPAISMAAANTTTNGYLTSTDWNTFNGKGTGTVTSVAALTIGTTGTDLSSTVATGTTTPVITLQVPTASATNRGALSAADWSTFNSKAPAVTYTTNYIPYGQGTTTPNQSSGLQYNGTYLLVGTTAVIGGLTNPITAATGSANNYVQKYVYNATNGTSASADVVAYPNNGSDTSGWVDMGITSQTYADAVYTVTGPNEAYLFGSAPSGAGKTGNLVYATDSTGTANAHQFYVGGFTQAKAAWKAQVDANGLQATQLKATNGIIVNSKTISASYTIASGDSAMSTGPITVASGKTVTISSGSRWVVL